MGITRDMANMRGKGGGVRNLIINGAMQVSVRGTSAVAAAANYPSIDRFKAWEDTDGAYTVEQSTTAPSGFTTSLKAQVTTADTSLAAAQYAQISQQIEAQNLQSLVYGTNDAKTVTLSFYVRSNKTGSYSITIYKADATSYLFSKSYTIASADTWERKSIIITPDSNIKASSGAIANDSGIGFYVFWNLAGGTNYDDATDDTWSSNTSHFHTSSQVNWMDSTSNNFYLTGVQLEIGTSASDFNHEDKGTTLARCQRYYHEEVVSWILGVEGTRNTKLPFPHKVTMRAAPTATLTGGSAANGALLGTTDVTANTTNFHFWHGSSGGLTNASFSAYTFKADAEL
tara:strand:- start:1183 stop:2211 length:1029 start_codon:yes stop_codon:yes gene_type:complete